MLLQIHHWLLDTHQGTLTSTSTDAEDQSLTLAHTHLELLLCLIRHAGENVTKETMLNEVWPNKVVTEEVLSVAISQIRKSLGDNARSPTYIKTIPGIGYRFIAEVSELPASQLPEKSQMAMPGNQTNSYIYRITALTFIIALGLILKMQLTEEQTHTGNQVLSQMAQDKYEKARYLLTTKSSDDWQLAKKLLQETIVSAPEFAPGYRDLVAANIKLHNASPGESAISAKELHHMLNRSLQLKPDDGITFHLKAKVSFFFEWNFAQAQKQFEQALRWSPENAEIHLGYGEFLLAKGDSAAALKHLQKHVQLNPKNYALPSITWAYNLLGEHQSALQHLQKLEETRPDSLAYQVAKQALLENMQDTTGAWDALFRIMELNHYTPEELKAVTQIEQEQGLSGVYTWLLEVKNEQKNIGQYTPPLSHARYAISAGQYDKAVELILEAKQKKQTPLLWLYADPKYRPILQNPKLKDLIKRQ